MVWVSSNQEPRTENTEMVSLPAFTATRSRPPSTRASPPWEANGSAVAPAAVEPSPPVAKVPA